MVNNELDLNDIKAFIREMKRIIKYLYCSCLNISFDVKYPHLKVLTELRIIERDMMKNENWFNH